MSVTRVVVHKETELAEEEDWPYSGNNSNSNSLLSLQLLLLLMRKVLVAHNILLMKTRTYNLSGEQVRWQWCREGWFWEGNEYRALRGSAGWLPSIYFPRVERPTATVFSFDNKRPSSLYDNRTWRTEGGEEEEELKNGESRRRRVKTVGWKLSVSSQMVFFTHLWCISVPHCKARKKKCNILTLSEGTKTTTCLA